jgi:hypothetical protein
MLRAQLRCSITFACAAAPFIDISFYDQEKFFSRVLTKPDFTKEISHFFMLSLTILEKSENLLSVVKRCNYFASPIKESGMRKI